MMSQLYVGPGNTTANDAQPQYKSFACLFMNSRAVIGRFHSFPSVIFANAYTWNIWTPRLLLFLTSSCSYIKRASSFSEELEEVMHSPVMSSSVFVLSSPAVLTRYSASSASCLVPVRCRMLNSNLESLSFQRTSFLVASV